MPDIVIHGIVSAMYVGLAWHFWNTRWRGAPSAALKPGLRGWERAAILVPLGLHGWLLYHGIVGKELRFGFAQALSVMMFIGVALYWAESLYYNLEGMQALVLPLAALAAPLPALFAGRSIPDSSTEFKLHLALAMIAYSLFIMALLHAALMALVERRLHRRSAASFPGNLPPLLTVEHSLFRVIAIAFVFLTLTLATGMALTDAKFGRLLRFNHEVVFAILSWVTFAGLLLGRYAYGWRGRTALRWTIAGFVLVLLANIGTAFVLEVILKRT